MKFSEIKQKIIDADNRALQDFNERANDFMRGPVGLEEQLSFVEYRRHQLAIAVGMILNELIACEERQKDTTPPASEPQGSESE